ncbi:MFS transporter [Legionella cardiaca]|uniref:MFS transporter n=1 Tax=Legionella cardiaca TaxID=1071983 RepID=A0ABY8AMZ7_9GAMM|nr:MFS transporter [Legionella cardiaca]WED42063.1 MFS transporter [Legionella cardiaca]
MKGLLSIIFFITMGSSIINPLVGPLIFSAQGFLPDAETSQKIHAYSLIMGFYALGMVIGNPIWGIIADKTQGKKALIWALIGTLLSYLLSIGSIVFTFFSLFVLSRFLDGLMAGRRVIAISMLLGKVEDKIKSFQLSEMANAAGLFLGPLCSGFLITFFNEKTSFYGYSLPFIVMFMAIVINLGWVGFFLDNTKRTVKTVVKKIDTSRGTFLIYGRFFIFQFAWYLYFLAITPYVITHWQFNSLAVGIFFSAMVILYFLFLSLLLLLKSVIRQELLAAGSLYLLILTMSFLSYFHYNFYLFLMGNVLIAFGVACSLPVFMAKILTQKQEDEHSTAIGIQNGLIGLAWLLATLVLSFFSFVPLNLFFLFAAVSLSLLPILSWYTKR